VCLSCSSVSTASSFYLAVGVCVGLSVCLLFFISLVLLCRHKHKKGLDQFITGYELLNHMNSNKWKIIKPHEQQQMEDTVSEA